MSEHPLRKLLTSILRGGANPTRFELAYIHRGAPDDTLKIKASEIKHVAKGSFLLRDGETQIPFHRILYIRDETRQSTLWEKRKTAHGYRAP